MSNPHLQTSPRGPTHSRIRGISLYFGRTARCHGARQLATAPRLSLPDGRASSGADRRQLQKHTQRPRRTASSPTAQGTACPRPTQWRVDWTTMPLPLPLARSTTGQSLKLPQTPPSSNRPTDAAGAGRAEALLINGHRKATTVANGPWLIGPLCCVLMLLGKLSEEECNQSLLVTGLLLMILT